MGSISNAITENMLAINHPWDIEMLAEHDESRGAEDFWRGMRTAWSADSS
jgi:hypothetical protein